MKKRRPIPAANLCLIAGIRLFRPCLILWVWKKVRIRSKSLASRRYLPHRAKHPFIEPLNAPTPQGLACYPIVGVSSFLQPFFEPVVRVGVVVVSLDFTVPVATIKGLRFFQTAVRVKPECLDPHCPGDAFHCIEHFLSDPAPACTPVHPHSLYFANFSVHL